MTTSDSAWGERPRRGRGRLAPIAAATVAALIGAVLLSAHHVQAATIAQADSWSAAVTTAEADANTNVWATLSAGGEVVVAPSGDVVCALDMDPKSIGNILLYGYTSTGAFQADYGEIPANGSTGWSPNSGQPNAIAWQLMGLSTSGAVQAYADEVSFCTADTTTIVENWTFAAPTTYGGSTTGPGTSSGGTDTCCTGGGSSGDPASSSTPPPPAGSTPVYDAVYGPGILSATQATASNTAAIVSALTPGAEPATPAQAAPPAAGSVTAPNLPLEPSALTTDPNVSVPSLTYAAAPPAPTGYLVLPPTPSNTGPLGGTGDYQATGNGGPPPGNYQATGNGGPSTGNYQATGDGGPPLGWCCDWCPAGSPPCPGATAP